MKKLFMLLIIVIFLGGAESFGYDSTMSGAEVEAELNRAAGRETTVGDPGSDAELVTEQAVREALDLKVHTDGSIPLTGNWDVGAYTLTGTQFISDIAIGTAPLVVTSTTVVTNLNADTLDGEEATAFEDADAAITKSDEAETITANWVNTANPWADDEVANSITLDLLSMSALTGAPGSPAACRLYRADTDTWDPGDLGGTDDVVYIYDGADYKPFWDETGALHISSIELPSYTHFATGDAPYNDTSTPHVLIAAEIKNGIITNAGATEDRVYTCPAAEFGINFMVQVIAAYQIDIEPNGTETLWLNGTQMAAGEHIINVADTKGDVMACWSVESGDGTYEIFCKSDNSNFTEATP